MQMESVLLLASAKNDRTEFLSSVIRDTYKLEYIDSAQRVIEEIRARSEQIYALVIDVPSEVIVLVRGSFGALLVLLFQLARGRTPDIAAIRDNLGWLVASGICLGLNWVFLFAAYAHTTVAIASLCNYMAPIIVIAISPVVFKERIGPRRLACILAALVGIMLVSVFPSAVAGGVDPTGAALGLAAAVGAALVIVAAAAGELIQE